jgi:hypothetical protein
MSFRLDTQTSGPQVVFCYGACHEKIRMRLDDPAIGAMPLTREERVVEDRLRSNIGRQRFQLWSALKRLFKK